MTDRAALREKIAKELFVARWMRADDTREQAEGWWNNPRSCDSEDRQECYADADRVLVLLEPLVGEREALLQSLRHEIIVASDAKGFAALHVSDVLAIIEAKLAALAQERPEREEESR